MHKNMKLILLFTILPQYLFALISISPMEIGEEEGLHGNVVLGVETKRGNTTKDNYKGALKLSYDNNTTYVIWSEVSTEYGKSNDTEDTNKQYMHTRYIHALTKEDIRTEIFGQLEEDKFKLIESRRLLGAGFRFKIFEIFKDAKAYIGLGGFYESIAYTSSTDPKEENTRLNSYFAYTAKFAKDSKLTYSFFYQPKFTDYKDYVQSHKLQLELHVYKLLFLNFQAAYDADTNPAVGIKNYDFTQTTSFVFKF